MDGFLSPQQCSALKEELEFAVWRPSLTYERQTNGTYHDVVKSDFRTSETANQQWYTEEMNQTLMGIETRIAEYVPLETVCLEPWQATRYAPNDVLDYHHDSGYWDGHYSGDRVWSFVLYLDTPKRGGGTHFRALDIHVDAMAGRLLYWLNLFPHGGCDHRKIHSGTPVRRGHKTILVTWLRQLPYRARS